MSPRKVINDRYELQRLPLARGGMGEVWLGHDVKLDREIAVKFVRFQDGVPDDDLVRRFFREARITARLQHPGVPAVFDVGTDEGRPYLVMQRVHGISVSDLLAQHDRLPVGWAAAIAAQVCSVLAAAHKASLVHRDLKPANLMLEPDGTLKVLDFGLAVALDLTNVSQITRSGQNIGTPAYMAPEQVLTAMSGPRTDLYSLGCTLYEMLTGGQVFTGVTSYSVMNKQVDEAPLPAREHRPDVPAALDALVAALLEKKPENRPESAETVYERLMPYATELGPLPGVLADSSSPSPARMYASVVSRVFQQNGPSEAERPGPADSGPTTTQDEARAAPVSRAQLEETRADASELATQARYREASELLEVAVRQARDSFGPLDPDVMNMRLEWANVLFEGGDYHAAAPAYEALATDLSERDGPDGELVIRCRAQYVTCYALLGDMEQALDAGQRLLSDQLRVYGRRDPRPLELRRQIGMWQLGAGLHKQAKQTLNSLLEDLVREYGDKHPAVPRVRELLASLPV